MKTLHNQIWYRPSEVARLGLIKNSVNSEKPYNNYLFILGLIKSGKLRAKDYGKGGKRAYWLIPESEIQRYHETVTRMPEVDDVIPE